MKPETRFRRSAVIPFLKTLAWCSFFPIQQVTMVGDADFIACIRGRFVWLELKIDGEPLRPMQEFKAAWVKRTGGIRIRCAPENWAQVKSLLTRLNQGETDVENEIL